MVVRIMLEHELLDVERFGRVLIGGRSGKVSHRTKYAQEVATGALKVLFENSIYGTVRYEAGKALGVKGLERRAEEFGKESEKKTVFGVKSWKWFRESNTRYYAKVRCIK